MWKLVLPALALGALAGCAALPADRGQGDLAALVRERGREIALAPARDQVAELLGRPLSADDVVRVALLANPTVRAQHAELGIAAAEVFEAGRLGNPTLSASVLFPAGGGGSEATFGLAQGLAGLLLLPARARLAAGEFERGKLQAAGAVLDLAAEAEAGYFELVGAQQVARMRDAVARAARASADLAQRFFDAGNISRLELAREQASATQARIDQLAAQGEVGEARARLARVMGVRAEHWTVVEALPLPPERDDDLSPLLALADRSRFDLAASRRKAELLGDALGSTRAFRFLGDVEVGVETTRESDGGRLTGPTLSLQLPLFNQGQGAVARGEAQMQLAQAELEALEIGIVNDIRSAHAAVATARSRVDQHRWALIPQREEIVRRTQEEVNYMLVGQFELLAAKQQEYDAYQGYLEAIRDYWVARAQLARSVGAPLPGATQATRPVDVDALIAPEDASSGHQHHGSRPEPPAPALPSDGAGQPVADPHAGHSMPTGMESHIPARAKDGGPGHGEPDEPAQPHGGHR